jgi:hypothetical protein
MRQKDELLLEKAYLSISKPVPGVPSEEEIPELNDVGADVESHIDDGSEDMLDGVSDVVSGDTMAPDTIDSLSSEESEEDEMVISNLDSIRESITKIASFCSGGGHLESWQQQKLAVAMDNLAEVARRIRR